MNIFTKLTQMLGSSIGLPREGIDYVTCGSYKLYQPEFLVKLVKEVYDIEFEYDANLNTCHTYFNIKTEYDIEAVAANGETTVGQTYIHGNPSFNKFHERIRQRIVETKSILLFDETATIFDLYKMYVN